MTPKKAEAALRGVLTALEMPDVDEAMSHDGYYLALVAAAVANQAKEAVVLKVKADTAIALLREASMGLDNCLFNVPGSCVVDLTRRIDAFLADKP